MSGGGEALPQLSNVVTEHLSRHHWAFSTTFSSYRSFPVAVGSDQLIYQLTTDYLLDLFSHGFARGPRTTGGSTALGGTAFFNLRIVQVDLLLFRLLPRLGWQSKPRLRRRRV